MCYCSTRLKACLQGICDWIVLVFKVLQELIDSSRSRFPLWHLLFDITERETTAPGQESSLEETVLSGQQEASNPQGQRREAFRSPKVSR